MGNKYRLKGHESFILREGWLTKALFALNDYENGDLFKVNAGADVLGVGTNMAKAIRYWMRTSGLSYEQTGKGVFLSDLGETILKYDPYIEDLFTLYIIHSNIVTNKAEATSWNVFFNNFDLNTFTRSDMIGEMTNLLVEATGESNLPERSIKDDCAAIINMYTRQWIDEKDPEEKSISPFAPLHLLGINGHTYEKTSPAFGQINPLIVLYIMSKGCDSDSILIDDIVEKENMPGRVMNLNRVSANEYLDILDDMGYVRVNRTAGLDIVYFNADKKTNPVEIVKTYFKG